MKDFGYSSQAIDNATFDDVTNGVKGAGCSITVVDLATDDDVVVTSAPAILLGVYVNTVLSAHVVQIKNDSTVNITLPASLAAGSERDFHGAVFSTNITIESDNSATGSIAVLWRAI